MTGVRRSHPEPPVENAQVSKYQNSVLLETLLARNRRSGDGSVTSSPEAVQR